MPYHIIPTMQVILNAMVLIPHVGRQSEFDVH